MRRLFRLIDQSGFCEFLILYRRIFIINLIISCTRRYKQYFDQGFEKLHLNFVYLLLSKLFNSLNYCKKYRCGYIYIYIFKRWLKFGIKRNPFVTSKPNEWSFETRNKFKSSFYPQCYRSWPAFGMLKVLFVFNFAASFYFLVENLSFNPLWRISNFSNVNFRRVHRKYVIRSRGLLRLITVLWPFSNIWLQSNEKTKKEARINRESFLVKSHEKKRRERIRSKLRNLAVYEVRNETSTYNFVETESRGSGSARKSV